MGLPGTIETPRPEDFGLTADDVARAPELVVTRFRPQLFIGLYATVVAVVFGLIFWSSGSIGAAVAFSVIGTAAISVVLIPVLVCVLCASEKAETKMLCRRFPQLTACLAYRDAMTEFKQLTRRSSEDPHFGRRSNAPSKPGLSSSPPLQTAEPQDSILSSPIAVVKCWSAARRDRTPPTSASVAS
jgi:hypothetical protein